MPQSKLEQILLHSNLINPADLAAAAATAAKEDKRLAWMLLEDGAIDERSFAELLSKGTDSELVDPLPPDIPPWVYRKLPSPIARQYKSVPLELVDSRLKVALLDPTDTDSIDVLAAATGLTIVPVVAVRSALERLLEHIYPFDVDVDATKLSPRTLATEPGMDTAPAIAEAKEPGVNTIAAKRPDLPRASGTTDLSQQLDQLEQRLNVIATLLGEARVTLAQLRRAASGK